jgi:hypothetical protein
LIYFWQFGNVVVIWYIFSRFGILFKEKYGNPGKPTTVQKRIGCSSSK